MIWANVLPAHMPIRFSRIGSRAITRSPAQKAAGKDLKRNGQDRAITLKAAYTPTSKRAGSRSQNKNVN